MRDAAGGGLRAGQAAGHGLRDDHRPRHDRRRPGDRRPARRVRLGGADRAASAASRRPCTSSASGSRRTTTSGCRRTPATSRSSPSTCTSTRSPARSRTRSTPSTAPLTPRHRRRLAAALPDLGGPQRLARARAQPAGRDLHRHARRHRHRRHRRPRRRRHRAHVDRDAGGRDARGVPRPRPRRPRAAPAATRARPPSGRTPRWRWRCARSAAATATRAPDPTAVLRMVERVMTEGDARAGAIGGDLGPEDARALLRAWLDVGRARRSTSAELLALLQSDGFSHADLERRARRCHERKLQARGRPDRGGRRRRRRARTGPPRRGPLRGLHRRPSPTRRPPRSSGARRTSCDVRDHEPVRVALVADGLGGMHGVTHTLDEIRERGVPGFEVEVIGTDAQRRPPPERRRRGRHPVLRRPEGRRPEPAGGRRGARRGPLRRSLHLCSPGPGGRGRALIGRVHRSCRSPAPTTPSSPPTRRCAPATQRLELRHAARARRVLRRLRRRALAVAGRPTRGSSSSGSPAERIGRWDRGVDLDALLARRGASRARSAAAINVLYAGRLTREKGADLLADAFLAARARDPRLHLVLAGGGPEEDALRAAARAPPRRSSAGSRATRSPRAYASRRPLPLLLAARTRSAR